MSRDPEQHMCPVGASAPQQGAQLPRQNPCAGQFLTPSLCPQPMKVHQDSLEEQQEKEMDAEPVYEEVGNFPELATLELQRGLLADPSPVPTIDRSQKPSSSPEQPPAPVLRSSLPPSPAQRLPAPSVTKAVSLERGLNLECDKTPSCGLRATLTASLERNLEPPTVLARDQEQTAMLGHSSSPETSISTKKRSAQPSSPISDKLIQELSSIILKKSDGQTQVTGTGSGQPVT